VCIDPEQAAAHHTRPLHNPAVLTLKVCDDGDTSAAEASCLGDVLLGGLNKHTVLTLLGHTDECIIGVTLQPDKVNIGGEVVG
jgi:hypothetical protein